MSGKINFILGVHNHLPNGAAEEDYEKLYNDQIRPLVSALYQFPRISVVFHYSGVLLYWIERRHPELFVLLDDLLNRKQAELLGGGFYEPMMPLLPLADRIGQIEMLTTYLRRQFGKRPQGCMLPANAWEQNLVVPLGACGMNYTFLDESCFSAAGAPQVEKFFYEPCITEEQGKIITVFPVFSSLGKIKPAAMLEKLKVMKDASCGGPVTVFPAFDINPGEKAESEFQHFFEELSSADSQIDFTTPGRIFKNLPGMKKLYFEGCPKGSSLPRQFLTICPEAGNIYAKMIHTRLLVNQLRGDKARKLAALEELLKAQDSALFCQKGIRNDPVRKAAYRALLEADKIAREKNNGAPSLSTFDYDLDGEDEYVFRDDKLNCYVKSRGACLFELDYLPKTCNFLDTFITEKIPLMNKNKGGAFTEYISMGTEVPQINRLENARYCGNEAFEAVKCDRPHRQVQFRLPSAGNIELCKTWYLKRNVINLQYDLKNTGSETTEFYLVPTAAFSFSGENTSDAKLRIMAVRGTAKELIAPDSGTQAELMPADLKGIEFQDLENEAVLSLECGKNFSARIYSAETSDVFVMIMLPVSLEKNKSSEISFSIRITS